MAEDVTYEDLSSREVYEGRAAVQAYVEETYGFSSDYRFVVVSAQADSRRYAIGGRCSGRTPARPAAFRPRASRTGSGGRRSPS